MGGIRAQPGLLKLQPRAVRRRPLVHALGDFVQVPHEKVSRALAKPSSDEYLVGTNRALAAVAGATLALAAAPAHLRALSRWRHHADACQSLGHRRFGRGSVGSG